MSTVNYFSSLGHTFMRSAVTQYVALKVLERNYIEIVHFVASEKRNQILNL